LYITSEQISYDDDDDDDELACC